MKLVIAEKPSVGISIAKVIGATERHEGYMEGNVYLVSWCLGHLVELVQPDSYDEKYKKWNKEDLPILPDPFQWQVSKDKKQQFAILKKLMERSDVTELICATDAGREGELIFRLVYNVAGCKKPFKRLWISSMEDKAIRDGFDSLKDGSEYDHLYEVALARSEADWLVGINATRLFTTLYNKRLTVGRVQTPTLTMLVERNDAILNFKKEKYFNVSITGNGLTASKEKIFSEDDASRLVKICNGEDAVITCAKETKKTINPPRLYDLTSLQREANRYYGHTAQEVLNAAQNLYEKKLITYPRTDSQYLTEDMEESVIQLIPKVYEFLGLEPSEETDVKRVINNAKVSDHHALLPTQEINSADLSAFSKVEVDILRLIASQLLLATGQKHEYLETEVLVSCQGNEFKAKGRQVITEGWKRLESISKRKAKDAEEPAKLSLLKEGDVVPSVKAECSEHYTTPPKQYTEDTLLSAMETAGNEHFDEDTEKKGIGTPATRASMIEKLVKSRYVERRGKQLIPTEDGIKLIKVLPEEIKSPKLTADWENQLLLVERGEENSETFLKKIWGNLKILTNRYSEGTLNKEVFFSGDSKKESLGKCPRCGSDVYEGNKNYYCSNRDCKFVLWKDNKWLSAMKKTLTGKMVIDLLKDGRTHVKGLYSRKKDKHFDADVVLDDTGQYVNFKLDFTNGKDGKKNG